MSASRRGPGLLFGNQSDPGRVRQKNEDYFGHFLGGGRHLLVVADGMGGEAGGMEASRLAVAAAQAVFVRDPGLEPAELLAAAVAQANLACLRSQEEHPELQGMGTTLELVLVEPGRAWWAHVGDSRIYLVRGAEARQLTADHTLIQRMIQDGLVLPEDAVDHPQRHVLSRVVGRSSDLEPDISPEPIVLAEGDALVLCSDGLTDVVSGEEIGWLVAKLGPQRACKRLVALANERGGHDNITVQIVYQGVAQRGWSKQKTSLSLPSLERSSRKGRRAPVLLGAAGLVALVGVGAVIGWGVIGGGSAPPASVSAADRDMPEDEAVLPLSEAESEGRGSPESGPTGAKERSSGAAPSMQPEAAKETLGPASKSPNERLESSEVNRGGLAKSGKAQLAMPAAKSEPPAPRRGPTPASSSAARTKPEHNPSPTPHPVPVPEPALEGSSMPGAAGKLEEPQEASQIEEPRDCNSREEDLGRPSDQDGAWVLSRPPVRIYLEGLAARKRSKSFDVSQGELDHARWIIEIVTAEAAGRSICVSHRLTMQRAKEGVALEVGGGQMPLTRKGKGKVEHEIEVQWTPPGRWSVRHDEGAWQSVPGMGAKLELRVVDGWDESGGKNTGLKLEDFRLRFVRPFAEAKEQEQP